MENEMHRELIDSAVISGIVFCAFIAANAAIPDWLKKSLWVRQ